MNHKSLENTVAVITGAAMGIGEATAIAFAKEGARVVLSDLSPKGEDVAALIRDNGGRALFIPADVSKPSDVKALIAGAVKAFGRIDVAFNNAGIGGEQAPVGELSDEGWEKTISVNLSGVFYCMKYEIQQLLAQGTGGAIINNASILGAVGFAGASAYVAAKHGVLGLSKTAAIELATKGIRVNTVCPGFIETPMLKAAGFLDDKDVRSMLEGLHPMKRLGTANEVANAVVFLASARASFVTGQSLLVDGGYTAQ